MLANFTPHQLSLYSVTNIGEQLASFIDTFVTVAYPDVYAKTDNHRVWAVQHYSCMK